MNELIHCWACGFEGNSKEIHISESYLRVSSSGTLVFVCKDHKGKFVDPMIIRKFRKLFSLKSRV